jgi:hypothetical protein
VAQQSAVRITYAPIPPATEIEPTTTVTGLVVDEDDKPVADAAIVAAHGRIDG